MVLKDKTTVTFHSGILTIGGTVIEVSFKDSHIFFDFGTEFRPEIPLPNEHLDTLLEYRLVPDLDNVYDKRLLEKKSAEDHFQHSAVFLSHAHLDHTKMINYLSPDIPLYTLEGTKKILQLLNKNETFLLPSPFVKGTREIISLNPEEELTIGEIKVTMIPVDHDAYGASGLIITTPTCQLAYTGDLRLHGFDPEDTLNFCQKAYQTDCLMMEGVSISFLAEKEKPGVYYSEKELQEALKEVIKEHPKNILVFNGYKANPKRFLGFSEVSPRLTVFNSETAALLKELFQKDEHYYYLPGEKTQQGLDPSYEISYDSLLNEPEKYFWQVTNFSDLPPETIYIHSDAEPLGDFDPAYALFLADLKKRQIQFLPMSCSGHAVPEDLKKIIAAIEPKLLVPIHTLHPELLENPYGNRILPVRGQKIYF